MFSVDKLSLEEKQDIYRAATSHLFARTDETFLEQPRKPTISQSPNYFLSFQQKPEDDNRAPN